MYAYRAQSFWVAAITILLLLFVFLSPSLAFGANDTVTPTCTGLSNFYNPWCWVQTLVQAVGFMAISLSGAVLGIAATLFDTLLSVTILQFGTYYGKYFQEGVELAWSTFRDITNIVIIGSFVFVAISTILQSQNYGYRQFVARLIIASVLINFSLFFCKISIDVSHIFAQQFLKGISSSATVNTDQPGQTNVAGEFMKASGVASVLDSWSVIKQVSEKSQSNTVALLYAVLTSTLFLALAVILLYGSSLLLVRIIVLTLLMLVSALAFGAIAVPGLQSWWKRWKKEFLKNVFFAPLLFMFLWATITIARRFGGSGSLADLAASPNSGASITALISYLIVIGLLFAAIHLSKSLSITTGAAYFSSLKNWQNILNPIATATASLKNAWRYQQSKKAQNEMGSEATGRKFVQLQNLKALDRQGRLDKADQKRMAILQREMNAQKAKASGNFNILKNSMLPGMASLNKGADALTKAGKIFSEGAGKGGYEKIAKEMENKEKKSKEMIDEKVAAAYKSNLPGDQEKRASADKEVSNRLTAVREDKSRIEELNKRRDSHERELSEIEERIRSKTATDADKRKKDELKLNIDAVRERIERARKVDTSEHEEVAQAVTRDVLKDLSGVEKSLKDNPIEAPKSIGKELDDLYSRALAKNRSLFKTQTSGPAGVKDHYNEETVRSTWSRERERAKKKEEALLRKEAEKEILGEGDDGKKEGTGKPTPTDSGGVKK